MGFSYTAPTVEQSALGRSKVQARIESAIHRGLQKIKAEEKLSLRVLCKKIEKEWQRTEKERAEAPSCPWERLRLYRDDKGKDWVVLYEETSARHIVGQYIPLDHYWDVILAGEAWGQYSIWDVWTARSRKLREQENETE